MVKLHESSYTPKTAYLFDIDGVLSDLEEKRVTEEELFGQIIKRLEKGEPIGLNSGRGLEWILEKIINPLIKKIKTKKY